MLELWQFVTGWAGVFHSPITLALFIFREPLVLLVDAMQGEDVRQGIAVAAIPVGLAVYFIGERIRRKTRR